MHTTQSVCVCISDIRFTHARTKDKKVFRLINQFVPRNILYAQYYQTGILYMIIINFMSASLCYCHRYEVITKVKNIAQLTLYNYLFLFSNHNIWNMVVNQRRVVPNCLWCYTDCTCQWIVRSVVNTYIVETRSPVITSSHQNCSDV